jgi:uncharacterized protein YsxB (DUF464 family)
VIKVTFYEDSRKRLSSFFADGHADFAEAGDDIVCSAVSAVLQAARLGLEMYVRTDVSVEQKKGHIRISWPETMRSDPAVKAIVETARLSVEQIARQFPANVHCNNAPEDRVV